MQHAIACHARVSTGSNSRHSQAAILGWCESRIWHAVLILLCLLTTQDLDLHLLTRTGFDHTYRQQTQLPPLQ